MLALGEATQRRVTNPLRFSVSLAAQGSKLADVGDCRFSPEAEVLRSSEAGEVVTAKVVPRPNGYNLELASNGWCAHVPIENALLPLITENPGQIFDDIILSDASGTVLYQTHRSGVITDNLASLRLQFTGKDSPGSSDAPAMDSKAPSGRPPSEPSTAEKSASLLSGAGGSSSVFQVTLAGANYRAYLVPVQLSVSRPSASVPVAGVRFVLCGLMLQKHFTTKSRSVPLTALAAIALAVILVIVGAWPVLKFRPCAAPNRSRAEQACFIRFPSFSRPWS